MRRAVLLVGCGLLVAPACSAPKVLSAAAACKLLVDRVHHVGETITFPGDYTSDHIEREVISPTGCRWGIGVRSTDRNITRIIEQLDRPESRKGVRARFTGKLVQVAPNGMLFFKDDGVRLNVTGLDHPVAFVWTPRL